MIECHSTLAQAGRDALGSCGSCCTRLVVSLQQPGESHFVGCFSHAAAAANLHGHHSAPRRSCCSSGFRVHSSLGACLYTTAPFLVACHSTTTPSQRLPFQHCPSPLPPPSPPLQSQLASFTESVMRHSALPTGVEEVINALPADAHPMGVLLTGICTLSTLHPEQNPALAGQNIYKSREVQDKQIVRLIGKVRLGRGGCLQTACC